MSESFKYYKFRFLLADYLLLYIFFILLFLILFFILISIFNIMSILIYSIFIIILPFSGVFMVWIIMKQKTKVEFLKIEENKIVFPKNFIIKQIKKDEIKNIILIRDYETYYFWDTIYSRFIDSILDAFRSEFSCDKLLINLHNGESIILSIKNLNLKDFSKGLYSSSFRDLLKKDYD